jgi:LIVCS family branched-chain amino acid:cation transporter
MAIVLVVLNVFDNFIAYQSIYKGALLGTFSISLFDGLKAAGVQMPATVNSFIESLPLFSIGFGWLLPAVIGSIIIVGYSKMTGNVVKSVK